MARDPKHKAFVDSIVDGAVGTAEISKRAMESAPSLAESMSGFLKGLIHARASGRITYEHAQTLYREMYVGLLMVGFTDVAQDAIDHGESTSQSIHPRSKELGADLLRVEKVSKPDFLQRALDRANGNA